MADLWKRDMWLVKERSLDCFPKHNLRETQKDARRFAKLVKQVHGGSWEIIPVTMYVQRRKTLAAAEKGE